jgi:hypothetical protein
LRILLTILAAVGVLVVGLAVAIAAGWLRLTPVDPFAHAPRPTTQAALDAQNADAAGYPDGDPSAGDGAPAPPEPPAADRTILLKAEDAKLSGRNVRRSDFGAGAGDRWSGRRRGGIVSSSVVTGWLTPEDSAEWTVDVPKAGKYAITFDYASSMDKRTVAGGVAGFVLTVGGRRITGELAPTHSGRAFELVDVGVVELPAGRVTLTIAPEATLRDALMNLRSVRLFPAE